jgi:hypothetical protein
MERFVSSSKQASSFNVLSSLSFKSLAKGKRWNRSLNQNVFIYG